MKNKFFLFIDSGIGGLSILKKSLNLFNFNFIYYADNIHCPYGNHSRKQIVRFICQIIKNVNCKYDINCVVLACNTATATTISTLRENYKDIIFIGSEPAIKLAVLKKFKNILVLTTIATAKQKKYKMLVKNNTQNVKIKTLKLKNFAKNIENYFLNVNYQNFFKLLKDIFYIKRIQSKLKNDCIVLGCTHYTLIKNLIKKYIDIPMIDGNEGIAKKLALNRQNQPNNEKFKHIFISSDTSKQVNQKYKKYCHKYLQID